MYKSNLYNGSGDLVLNCISQVVEVDHGYRERIHNYQLHNYMYGQVIQPPPGITLGTLGGESLTDFVLSPSSTVINFGDLQIYRIGSGRLSSFNNRDVLSEKTIRYYGSF